MYHNNRRWSVQQVCSADELADKLLDYTWCGCCGFELDGVLWLNDSTSPDALQEFAVVERPGPESADFVQYDSITVSWCNRQQLLNFIEAYRRKTLPALTDATGPVVRATSVADLFQSLGILERPAGWVVHPRIESPSEHGRCGHCA